jgi:hypothetical protein
VSDQPYHFFQGNAEEEERFKYEVIRGLSESVRELASGMAAMQKTQVGMLERLATLEASKFAEVIGSVKADVAILMVEKNHRDGAKGAFAMIKEWAPFVGFILTAAIAFVIYGRMVGVVAPSPVAPTRVEAQIHPEERRIEGTVGGKP